MLFMRASAFVGAFGGGAMFAATRWTHSEPPVTQPTVADSLAAFNSRLTVVEERLAARAGKAKQVPPSNSVPTHRASSNTTVSEAAATHDVIIIGGGIVGVSLAYQLAKRSLFVGVPVKVAVLEAGNLGDGATGLSAATIWSAGVGDGSSVGATICNGTIELLREVEALGFDCELEECGSLKIGCSPDEVQMLRKSAASQRAAGLDATLVEGNAAVAALEPGLAGGSVLAALYNPHSGHIDPLTATVAIADAAVAMGKRGTAVNGGGGDLVSVHEQCSVVGLRPVDDQLWAVEVRDKTQTTPQEKAETETETKSATTPALLRAKHVVLAAGTGCVQLGRQLGVELPIHPVKGIIWSTDPQPLGVEEVGRGLKHCIFISESHLSFAQAPSRDDAAGIPEHCTHDKAGTRHVRHAYGRQRSDGTIIFGGSRMPLSLPLPQDALNVGEREHDEMASNYAHVSEFFPAVRAYGHAGAWAGVMPFSRDGPGLVGSMSPLLQGGRFASRSGMWLAGGFGPHGIMEGPGAMKFLGEEIVDEIRGVRDQSENGAPRAKVLAALSPCRASAWLAPPKENEHKQ